MTPFDISCLLGALLGTVFAIALGLGIAWGRRNFEADEPLPLPAAFIPGWIEALAIGDLIVNFRQGYAQASRPLRVGFLGSLITVALSAAAWIAFR